MTRAPRALTPEEARLWRRVAKSVKAARPQAEFVEPESQAPPARQRSATSQTPIKPKPAPPRSPPAPADRGGEKRARRGALEIGAALDLHGHTQDQALRALARFLAAAQRDGYAAVLVVTGKGRFGEEGVLRRRLPDWLAMPTIRPLIAGFAQAHQRHGGAGAFYVFVKRRGAEG